MPKEKLSIVALPHTEVSSEFAGCAYTHAKILKACKMLGGEFDITLYAPEGPEVEGATLVPVISRDERIGLFGPDDKARLPAWPTDAQSALFNERCITALRERLGGRELLCLAGGLTHLSIAQEFHDRIVCEPFCGFEGVIGGSVWTAYESYGWMHRIAALRGYNDIRWLDCVINPYVDMDDFPHVSDGKGKFLLCVARLINRKGVSLAGEIARAAGMPLVVAGAGGKQVSKTRIECDDGTRIECDDLTYLGPIRVEQRAKLFSEAYATLAPTYFQEPGCNVMFESMAAGVPVLSMDWGIFSEVIRPGFNGFFFRSMKQAVDAVRYCRDLEPDKIRADLAANHSLEATMPKFWRWFDRLNDLWGKGFYAE